MTSSFPFQFTPVKIEKTICRKHCGNYIFSLPAFLGFRKCFGFQYIFLSNECLDIHSLHIWSCTYKKKPTTGNKPKKIQIYFNLHLFSEMNLLIWFYKNSAIRIEGIFIGGAITLNFKSKLLEKRCHNVWYIILQVFQVLNLFSLY